MEPSIFRWVTEKTPTRRAPRVRQQLVLPAAAAYLSNSPDQSETERHMKLDPQPVSEQETSEEELLEQGMFDAATQTDVTFESCLEESTLGDTVEIMRSSTDEAFIVKKDLLVNCQDRISSLEEQLQMCHQQLQELIAKCNWLETRQFSLSKIQNDNAAISFYTGFSNYDALISFFNY